MDLRLDGKTALDNGVSQWITSEEARADGHAWRARACAVLTGVGTVQADNPQLNVRFVDTGRQPLKVLVDSRLEIDPEARLWAVLLVVQSLPYVAAVYVSLVNALEQMRQSRALVIPAAAPAAPSGAEATLPLAAGD